VKRKGADNMSARAILELLEKRARKAEDGTVAISHVEIGQAIGCSPITVKRRTRDLEAAKLVQVVEAGHAGKPTVYRVPQKGKGQAAP